MGGCASSKPKVKDDDREPYGTAADDASESSRKKTKVSAGVGVQQTAKSSPPDATAPPGAVEKGATAAVQREPLDKPEVIKVDSQREVKSDDKKPEQVSTTHELFSFVNDTGPASRTSLHRCACTGLASNISQVDRERVHCAEC